jgi:hypothetical protein
VKGTRRSAGCDREFDDDSDIERLIAEAEPWPDPPDPSVYHGPIGEAVQTIAPNTEADPVAVLVQLLVGFGNLVGRGAHLLIEDTPHFANEFVVIIGESSAARKGTSWRRVLKFLGLLERSEPLRRTRVGSLRDPVHRRGSTSASRAARARERDSSTRFAIRSKRWTRTEMK